MSSSTYRLEELVDLRIGRTPPRKEKQWFSIDEGIKWISIRDLGESGKYVYQTNERLTHVAVREFNVPIIPKDTLVLSFKLTVGKLAFTTEDMVSNEAIAQLPVKDNQITDSDYLYYYFLNYDFKNLGGTSSIAFAVNSNTLRNIKVNLPDVENQSKVSKILGDLDQKIELNRRMNETLEQIGQTLFKKYFVDNPEGEGWGEKPLDEIAEFKNGLAAQKYPPSQDEKRLRVIKIREMSSGFTNTSDIVGADFPEDYVVKNGDLLFAWSGTLMIKIWTGGEGALNQHIFKVTSKEYPKWFYYHWINEHLERFVMIAKSKTVTMGHIKRSHLSEVNVKIPPQDYLQQYDQVLANILQKTIQNSIEIDKLSSIRDILLPKLISGEVTV